MRRFKFRLQTLLNYRETVEHLREQELNIANGRFLIAQQRLRYLQDEFTQTFQQRPGATPGERFDAFAIADRERYLFTLQAAIQEQQRRVDAAQIVLEEKRTALIEARQAREAVQRLFDKELAAYKTHVLQTEQKLLDDLASTRRTPLPQLARLKSSEEKAA